MSVNPLLLYVIQMPSVLTILAAMSAIVLKAMLETEHHAPVSTDGIRLLSLAFGIHRYQ